MQLLKDENLGATVSTIVVTVVLLIFGEISPKTIARKNPERVAMLSAPFLQVLMTVLSPVGFVFGVWQDMLNRVFKSSDDSGITEQELLTIVDEAEQGDGIDADEAELIRSAIEFNELEVRDIFTPRIDIEAIRADMTKEEVVRLFPPAGL